MSASSSPQGIIIHLWSKGNIKISVNIFRCSICIPGIAVSEKKTITCRKTEDEVKNVRNKWRESTENPVYNFEQKVASTIVHRSLLLKALSFLYMCFCCIINSVYQILLFLCIADSKPFSLQFKVRLTDIYISITRNENLIQKQSSEDSWMSTEKTVDTIMTFRLQKLSCRSRTFNENKKKYKNVFAPNDAK